MYICMVSSTKTGKVKRTLESMSVAMLKLYALQNTKPSETTLVYNEEDMTVQFVCIGNKNSFPKVHEEFEGMKLNPKNGVLVV